MTGSPANTRISRRTIAGRAAAGEEVGLQGVEVPTAAAAIAKAVTGMLLPKLSNLVIEHGFLMEGHHRDELPERLLGCLATHKVDFDKSVVVV